MAGIILGWKVYHKVREHLFRGEWVDHKTAVQHMFCTLVRMQIVHV